MQGITIHSDFRFNRIAWGSGVIACGKENGEMDLWDASKVSTKQDEKAALNLRTKNHSGPVRGLDFNSIDTHLLASGSTDGEVLYKLMTDSDLGYESAWPTLRTRGKISAIGRRDLFGVE